MERSNDQWIAALDQPGPERELALADLREQLVRGLGFALADRAKVRDSDLQDFAQDAMLKILDGLHTFRGESRFTTWAQKIAVRVAFTELRRRRWRDVSLDELTENTGDLIPYSFQSDASGPEDLAAQRILLSTLRRLIKDELTDRQKEAMTAVLRGMPLEEVADKMGTNRNALYKLLHDGRQRLQKKISDEGLSPEDVLSVFDN